MPGSRRGGIVAGSRRSREWQFGGRDWGLEVRDRGWIEEGMFCRETPGFACGFAASSNDRFFQLPVASASTGRFHVERVDYAFCVFRVKRASCESGVPGTNAISGSGRGRSRRLAADGTSVFHESRAERPAIRPARGDVPCCCIQEACPRVFSLAQAFTPVVRGPIDRCPFLPVPFRGRSRSRGSTPLKGLPGKRTIRDGLSFHRRKRLG
jgi:hypothetical protein